jgi:hypothetical protein
MFKNKKGMSIEFIVSTIIVLIAFMIIAGVITQFVNRSDLPVAEKMCQDSVAMKVNTALISNGKEIKWSPLMCKTLDLKTKDNKEDTMYLIAEKSARAWEMFGAGKYEEILDTELFRSTLGFPKKTNDCFVSYSILTGEFVGEITPQEMQEYMSTHNYSRYPDTTYLDYITYKGGGPGVFMMVGPILPKHAYAIDYNAKNTDKFDWGFTIGGATLAGLTVIGGVITCPFTAGVGCGIAVTAIAGAGIITASYEIGGNIQKLSTERDVSFIWVGPLDTAQEYCFKGDIAGK